MAILFYSVTDFEIQPERTKRRVKRDDLDTLSEVWVGPTDQEDTFVPNIGSGHPQYNLMTVINTSVKRMPGWVSEVTINYQGKLDNSGTGAYTSVPTIGFNWAEGEVSYQRASSVTTGGVTQPGVATISRRYTGRCASVAYITNRRPTGNPTNIGLSKDFLGFTNVWEIQSGFQFGASTGQQPPILQLTCTDVRVEDRAEGWYRVTETYQSRQFPGAVSTPSGTISVKTTLPGSGNVTSGSDAGLTSGAAQGAATWLGEALPSSPAGTAGYDSFLATAIDPAWAPVQQSVLAAVAATGGPSLGPSETAVNAQPLNY